MELPGEEDGSKHKGIRKHGGQRDDGKDHSKRNLESLEDPWIPSLWGLSGIPGSVGGLLEKVFH